MIEPRSGILPRGIHSTTIDRQFRSIWNMIDAQLWSIVADHAKIVAFFESPFEAKFKPNQPGFETTMPLSANCSHDAATDAHDSLHHSQFQAQFLSLKSHVLLHCFGTFDRFVKELSEFRGRSLVHRYPPAFRLNFEGIGVGLITNSSLISSNFPLEFRNSVRKDPSKFTPIGAN